MSEIKEAAERIIERYDSSTICPAPTEYFELGANWQHKVTIDKVTELIVGKINKLENAIAFVNNNIVAIKIQTLTDLIKQMKEL